MYVSPRLLINTVIIDAPSCFHWSTLPPTPAPSHTVRKVGLWSARKVSRKTIMIRAQTESKTTSDCSRRNGLLPTQWLTTCWGCPIKGGVWLALALTYFWVTLLRLLWSLSRRSPLWTVGSCSLALSFSTLPVDLFVLRYGDRSHLVLRQRHLLFCFALLGLSLYAALFRDASSCAAWLGLPVALRTRRCHVTGVGAWSLWTVCAFFFLSRSDKVCLFFGIPLPSISDRWATALHQTPYSLLFVAC